jgi:hypothetical protein
MKVKLEFETPMGPWKTPMEKSFGLIQGYIMSIL